MNRVVKVSQLLFSAIVLSSLVRCSGDSTYEPPDGSAGSAGSEPQEPDYLGTGCLEAATPVATATGPRPIGSLEVGDQVWSVDLATGQPRLNRVTATRALLGDLQTLELANGTSIQATGEHPFYDMSRGQFVSVAEMGADVELWAPSLPGRRPTDTTQPARVQLAAASGVVVDITVERDHNFVAAGVLVHNKTGGFRGDGSECLPEVLEGEMTPIHGGYFAAAYNPAWANNGLGGAGQSLGGSAGGSGSDDWTVLEFANCSAPVSALAVSGTDQIEIALPQLGMGGLAGREWVPLGADGAPWQLHSAIIRVASSYRCLTVREYDFSVCDPFL